jgi:hypothetical protein
MTVETTEHTLHIPDETGDTRIVWDPADADSIATAKAAFDEAIRKGMVAYAVDPATGEADTQGIVREFDATKTKLIMMRQLQGG